MTVDQQAQLLKKLLVNSAKEGRGINPESLGQRARALKDAGATDDDVKELLKEVASILIDEALVNANNPEWHPWEDRL